MILSWFFENFFVANKTLWMLCGGVIILTYIGVAILLSMFPTKERKRFLRDVLKPRRRDKQKTD